MKIQCEQFQRYHMYTHHLIETTLCRVLGIDNTGNIEVFYILPIRHALVVYLQVSNINVHATAGNNIDNHKPTPTPENDKQTLFAKFETIAWENGSLNEAFKHDLSKKLRLFKISGARDAATANLDAYNNGNNNNNGEYGIIGARMKILLEQERSGLSVDTTTVDIQLSSKVEPVAVVAGGSEIIRGSVPPQLALNHVHSTSVTGLSFRQLQLSPVSVASVTLSGPADGNFNGGVAIGENFTVGGGVAGPGSRPQQSQLPVAVSLPQKQVQVQVQVFVD